MGQYCRKRNLINGEKFFPWGYTYLPLLSYRSTGDGSEMIRFIILNNFIFSSFLYSYIVVDLTFSDYLIVCIPLANIEILFHPAKRITIILVHHLLRIR